VIEHPCDDGTLGWPLPVLAVSMLRR